MRRIEDLYHSQSHRIGSLNRDEDHASDRTSPSSALLAATGKIPHAFVTVLISHDL